MSASTGIKAAADLINEINQNLRRARAINDVVIAALDSDEWDIRESVIELSHLSIHLTSAAERDATALFNLAVEAARGEHGR